MEETNVGTKKERSNFRMTVAWKNFRTKLIEERGAVCECCGTRYYGKQKRGLQIHHLDPDHYKDLAPEKFVILDSSCHELIERISTKLIGKKSYDIPCLENWVRLLYKFLSYRARAAIRKKHNDYLSSKMSTEWENIRRENDQGIGGPEEGASL